MHIRDKIERYGVTHCSLPELLQYLVNPPSRRASDLSATLERLALADLLHLDPFGLEWQYQLTHREASVLAALGEILRQWSTPTRTARPRITSPGDAAQLLMPRLRYQEQENFLALLLNTKNEVLAEVTVSIGTLDMSVAHPREVFKSAIRCNSAGVILAHNHPSGDPLPSPEDGQLTRQLVEAGKLLGIEVVDHLVIGNGRWVSLREKGLL